jgi:hypothetical protein
MSMKLVSIDIAADIFIILGPPSVHANVCMQVCVSLDFRYSRRLIAPADGLMPSKYVFLTKTLMNYACSSKSASKETTDES